MTPMPTKEACLNTAGTLETQASKVISAWGEESITAPELRSCAALLRALADGRLYVCEQIEEQSDWGMETHYAPATTIPGDVP